MGSAALSHAANGRAAAAPQLSPCRAVTFVRVSRGIDGPSEDGFDFHLPIPVDAAHLARLLGDVAMGPP